MIAGPAAVAGVARGGLSAAIAVSAVAHGLAGLAVWVWIDGRAAPVASAAESAITVSLVFEEAAAITATEHTSPSPPPGQEDNVGATAARDTAPALESPTLPRSDPHQEAEMRSDGEPVSEDALADIAPAAGREAPEAPPLGGISIAAVPRKPAPPPRREKRPVAEAAPVAVAEPAIPSSPFRGEKEGPVADRREGEKGPVVALESSSSPRSFSPPGAGSASVGAGVASLAATAPGFRLGSAANPLPGYPTIARKRGWEGRVELAVDVGPDGRVRSIAVAASSGRAALDRAASEAVAAWTFEPARRAGIPVGGWVTVPIRFRLSDP